MVFTITHFCVSEICFALQRTKKLDISGTNNPTSNLKFWCSDLLKNDRHKISQENIAPPQQQQQQDQVEQQQ